MSESRVLAHYQLRRQIGRGGMGVVYQAYDTRLQRQVAIKVLPALMADAPGRKARLMREARAAAKLNHPAIATIYEVGETHTEDSELAMFSKEVIYIAMEYVEGDDLSWRLQEGLAMDEAVDIAAQIAEGLASAHRAGVIHRDLKPGNVRITPEGRAKILDFGLAKIDEDVDPNTPTQPALTKTGVVVGTIPYMAPEQFEGTGLDERADLFSLGVILYQMLTGSLPFAGARLVDYVRALANQEPESPSKSNPHIPDRLGRVVERLLAKDPEDRYPSATAVCGELRAIASGDPGSVPTLVDSTYRSALRPQRRPWPKEIWGVAAMLLLALAVWAVFRTYRPPPPVRSVAVLPFENRTADPSLDAYYEGIGASLTRKLSRVPGVNAISELDVRRYRGTTLSAEEIARQLDVGTLVQGYVQGNAERIVIVARVQSAVPSVAVWDGEIDGPPDELLDLQERLADQVIRNLPVSLSVRERQRLRENPTRSREAYRLYAQGNAALQQVDDPTSAERAVEHFERAIQADPEFSWAHAGLSQALVRRYRADRSPELLDRSVAAADRAIELDPDLAELRITRARALRTSGRLDEAITELSGVLESNPDLDEAHRELAVCYWDSAALDLAEKSFRRATEIRPGAWEHWNRLGAFLWETGRAAEAREQLVKAIELAPQDVIRPLENLGTLELTQGDTQTALAIYEQIPETQRTVSLLTNMGALYFVDDRLEKAEAAFRATTDQQPEEPVHWMNLGDAQLQRGHATEATASYSQGVGLTEKLLTHNPEDLRLRVLRPTLLAKAGNCPRATVEAVALRSELSGKLERLLYLAKAFAVCEHQEAAIDTVTELIRGGMPTERLQAEFELTELFSEPDLAQHLP
ncbi:MAG: protein kinase [Acidobacteriota bacterium]